MAPPPGIFRRLRAIERDRLRDHLLRLGDDDRLLRFGGYVGAAQVEAYCDSLDWSRAVVIGYLVGDEARAIGELKPTAGGWSGAGEVAVSVERPFRNRGVGTELRRRLRVAARNRLIRTLWLVCLAENGGALRLARKLGGTLTVHPGTAETRIELPWPNPLTLSEELFDEAGAALHAALRPVGPAASLQPGRRPAPVIRPFRPSARRRAPVGRRRPTCHHWEG